MPRKYHKKPTKVVVRKPYRTQGRRPYKRTRMLNTYSSIPRGIASRPFPQKLFKVLTYSQPVKLSATFTTGLGPVSPSTISFRGNNIFDPDPALGGGQPRYFDTFCGANDTNAPYRKYTVLGSKIHLTLFPEQDSGTSTKQFNSYVSIIPRESTSVSAPSSLEEMIERPFSRSIPISSVESNKPYRLSHYMKTKQLMRVKDVLDVSNLSADYNANPSRTWEWMISLCSISNNAAATVTCQCMVTLKYYVMFSGINDVIDS